MRRTSLVSAVAMAWVGVVGVQLAHADVFTDGFEGSTLDPYWSTREESGSITLSSSGQVHSGTQAAQFNSTYNTGEKDIRLIHDYGQPMYGRVSVWLYDTGADVSSSNYLKLYLFDSEDNSLGGLGTADFDLGPGNGGEYQAGLPGTPGHTEPDRTQGWHLFEIEMLPDSATIWIDGTEVAAKSTGLSFQTLHLAMLGPTWRPAWVSYWDDFEADVVSASCSDGIIDAAEACDDGNADDGDGCSSTCTVEEGYACVGEPSMCGPDCNGNGIPDECDLDCGTASGPCDVLGCGQSQDNNVDGIPDECGACCGPQDCVQTTQAYCETSGKYRGDATTCATQENCAGIPTVSQWGLVVMTLVVLTAGTIVLVRRRSVERTV